MIKEFYFNFIYFYSGFAINFQSSIKIRFQTYNLIN